MTRNTVEDFADTRDHIDPAPEKRQSAPRRRRTWVWALGFVIGASGLMIGTAAWTFPQRRTATVAAVQSLWASFVNRDAVAAAVPRPPMVRVAIVKPASSREAHFTGVVHARYESALGFRVAGKIIERLVDTGEHVRKGQPLMRLDDTDFALALRAAHSEADAARAMATQTEADEVRQRALVGKGQATWQLYERSKAAADSAASKLAAALSQERQAENQAAYAVLYADADSVVMETSGEPGQVVALGQAVVRLARDGAREAEVYIPEGEHAAEAGFAALYSKPNTWFSAKLRETSASADPLTRTFRARYVLDGNGRNAPLGATVTIRVPKAGSEPIGVEVPAGALFDQGDGARVWVIDRASSKVAARSIRVLHVGDEDAAVSGDLEPGERVVALGAHLLREGENVAIAQGPIDTSAR